MIINVEDYLSEESKREIAKEWFRDTLSAKYRENPERIISNAAYYIVSQECDKITPEFQELLVQNVKKVITQLTAHTVFNKPDAWDRDGNSSYHLLKGIVASKRERLENKVDKIIDKLGVLIQALIYYMCCPVRGFCLCREFGLGLKMYRIE